MSGIVVPSRRLFIRNLIGGIALVTAPGIARADSLMRIIHPKPKTRKIRLRLQLPDGSFKSFEMDIPGEWPTLEPGQHLFGDPFPIHVPGWDPL